MLEPSSRSLTLKSLGLCLVLMLASAAAGTGALCWFGYIHNYTYYSDDTHTQQVGFCQFNECKNRWNCWGQQTPSYGEDLDFCSTCTCQQSCP